MGKLILNGKEYTSNREEMHNYSTIEQVVGTWLDEKPLYEITYQDTLPIVTTGTNVTKTLDLSSLNVSKVIEYSAVVITSGGYYKLPYSYNDGNGGKCYYNTSQNTFNIIANSANMSECQFFAIFQYTKTTD